MGSTPKEDKDFILKNMVEFAQSLARPTTKFVVNALTDSVGKDSRLSCTATAPS